MNVSSPTYGEQTWSRVTAFSFPRKVPLISTDPISGGETHSRSPQEGVTNAKFHRSINSLTQIMTTLSL